MPNLAEIRLLLFQLIQFNSYWLWNRVIRSWPASFGGRGFPGAWAMGCLVASVD